MENFDPMAGYEVPSRHCMIDLETVDNVATAAIASIGAVMFDANGLYDEFYMVVDHQSALAIGMTSNADTLDWWSKQCDEAKAIFLPETKKYDIKMALLEFSSWYKNKGGQYAYGNGSDFDIAIMNVAYRLAGMTPPWGYSSGRCFRTLKHKGKIENRIGTHHNALEDAKSQAQYLIDHKLVQEL